VASLGSPVVAVATLTTRWKIEGWRDGRDGMETRTDQQWRTHRAACPSRARSAIPGRPHGASSVDHQGRGNGSEVTPDRLGLSSQTAPWRASGGGPRLRASGYGSSRPGGLTESAPSGPGLPHPWERHRGLGTLAQLAVRGDGTQIVRGGWKGKLFWLGERISGESDVSPDPAGYGLDRIGPAGGAGPIRPAVSFGRSTLMRGLFPDPRLRNG
jgi:hypothetical protein